MRGKETLKNGQPISAVFLTRNMTSEEVRPYCCPYCGHCGEDVLRYEAKVGGSDQLVTQSHCADIDACLARQEEKEDGQLREECSYKNGKLVTLKKEGK